MSAHSCMSRNTSGPPVWCGGGGIAPIPDRRHCPRCPVEVPHFAITRRPPHFYSAVPNYQEKSGRSTEISAGTTLMIDCIHEILPSVTKLEPWDGVASTRASPRLARICGLLGLYPSEFSILPSQLLCPHSMLGLYPCCSCRRDDADECDKD